MADVTIGDIRTSFPASNLTGADFFELEQGGASTAATLQQLFEWLNGQTYTNVTFQRFSETTATATAAIDRANGGIQTLTLTQAETLTVAMANGESLTLHIEGGDANAPTWPAMTWIGGSAPVLSAEDVVALWMKGETLYGAHVGSLA